MAERPPCETPSSSSFVLVCARPPPRPRRWTTQAQRTLHSRPIIMLATTNCEQKLASLCPVCRATPPHNAAHHRAATFPPAIEALPVTMPLAGHAFPALQALDSVHALHSEPASVAADRPAPRNHLMPIADATVFTGHAPPSARASTSSSNAGSELLVGLIEPT